MRLVAWLCLAHSIVVAQIKPFSCTHWSFAAIWLTVTSDSCKLVHPACAKPLAGEQQSDLVAHVQCSSEQVVAQ